MFRLLTFLCFQTTAFFQKMAGEIDWDTGSKPDVNGALLEGQISREEREPLKPVFEPMRRKMHIPGL